MTASVAGRRARTANGWASPVSSENVPNRSPVANELRAGGGIAMALAGGEGDDLEATRDPTDLIGAKLLEDRQFASTTSSSDMRRELTRVTRVPAMGAHMAGGIGARPTR
jgi:hypothetical protein